MASGERNGGCKSEKSDAEDTLFMIDLLLPPDETVVLLPTKPERGQEKET